MCQEAKKFKSKHENLQCHVFKLMLVSCTEWNVLFFFNKSPPLIFTEGQLPAIRHYFESLNWLQIIHEQPWCWKSAVLPISNRSVPEKAPLIVVYQCICGPCTMKQLQHTEIIFCFVDSNPSLWCRHLVQTILFIPLFILPLTLYVSAYTNNNFCIKRF